MKILILLLALFGLGVLGQEQDDTKKVIYESSQNKSMSKYQRINKVEGELISFRAEYNKLLEQINELRKRVDFLEAEIKKDRSKKTAE